MTIRIDESIRGIWYCVLMPDEQDFLLALNCIAEEEYVITYRFRYYNSDDPFDDEDEKNWYSCKGTGKSGSFAYTGSNYMKEEIIAAIRIITSSMSEATEILRGNRSLDEFMEQDFVHTKEERIKDEN